MGAKHVPLVGHLCEHTARLFSAKLKTIICLQEWQMVVTEASNCSAGHSEFVLLPMLLKSDPCESCSKALDLSYLLLFSTDMLPVSEDSCRLAAEPL